jgi:uncharacterized RDD family membrane protein YckC
MTSPDPGWYPDPQIPMQMRWWDGSGWTEDTYQRVEPMDDWTRPAESVAAHPAAAHPARATEDGQPLADWWARAAARSVDALLNWALALVVGASQVRIMAADLGPQISRAAREAERGGAAVPIEYGDRVLVASAALVGVWLLVTLGYDLVFLLWRGATPGKLLLGLRLRPRDADRRLTGWMVVRRWLAFQVLAQLSYIGAAYAVVDLLWPLRDVQRRTLHDRAAGTVVVRARVGANLPAK